MNISISIHDTQADVTVETHQQSKIERSPEADTNIELYSAGWFDGLIGLNAELPHVGDYWSGYQIGYREYCCGLIGVEISNSKIPPERLASLMAA